MGLAAFNRMRRLKAEKEKQQKELAQLEHQVDDEAQQVKENTKALKDLTVPELKKLAESLGLISYSDMKKAELIKLIESAQASEKDE